MTPLNSDFSLLENSNSKSTSPKNLKPAVKLLPLVNRSSEFLNNATSSDTDILFSKGSPVETVSSTAAFEDIEFALDRHGAKVLESSYPQDSNDIAHTPSQSAKEAERKTKTVEDLRKLLETTEQKAKKQEVIRTLKEQIQKITNVQLSIHQLVSSHPFEGDQENERLLNSLDGWASLPFNEFDIQTAREIQSLHRKMMSTIQQFKNVVTIHRKEAKLNRSLNTRRKSIAMKIVPTQAYESFEESDLSHHSTATKTKEVATQVTSRLSDTVMPQTSPRTVEIEPLDSSSYDLLDSNKSADNSGFLLNNKPAPVATQVTARLSDTVMPQTSPRTVGIEPLDLLSLEKTHTSAQTPENEQDETKNFRNDDFDRSLEDEQSSSNLLDSNNSADDSGFLLNNKPAPRLKSIFDNVDAMFPGLQEDTLRPPPHADETTFVEMDMEEYCQKDFLKEIGPIMAKQAIEFQNELRGLDWISAQDVWKPPSFEDIHMDYYDHFDYFDSYSMLIWGSVVDLINHNYLKFNRKMRKDEEIKFEKETLEMLMNEHGLESKKKEWCKEVKLSKKLNGMMPYDLDYRYDIRRALPENDKQKYQRQQVQMSAISNTYPKKKLIDELNKVYNSEKEKLGHMIINAEVEELIQQGKSDNIPINDNVAVADV